MHDVTSRAVPDAQIHRGPAAGRTRRILGGTRATRREVREVGPLGVACAGGLARCFAILGALIRLEENGVVPDVLSGTSSGCLAAVLVARFGAEGTREAIGALCRAGNRAWTRLVGPGEPSRLGWGRDRGWISFRPLGDWVEAVTGVRRIEDLPKRVSICATDVETGRPRFFTRGPLGTACAASCSLRPAQPVRWEDGRLYIDGGYSANVPVRTCYEEGCARVIALDGLSRSQGDVVTRVRTAKRIETAEPGQATRCPDAPADYWLPMGERGQARFDLTAWEDLVRHGYRLAEPLARRVRADAAGAWKA